MDFKLIHGFDYPKPFSDSLKFGRSVPRGLLLRETGLKLKQNGISKEFQWAAEDKLVLKNHELMPCHLPGPATRSTFLMVFSPDGKRVASTHGNHNVYVTDLANGKNINILSGHPRTPWCVAFHPSSNQILASGCLAGQVRVWDLSGGSEVWTVKSQTVIASIAFHPTDRMLVIATYNELYFWDWSQPEPFAKCHTSNEKEKVRYIAFDPLGHKLITGISNAPNIQSQWDRPPVAVASGFSHVSAVPTQDVGSSTTAQPRSNVPPDQERRISICYRSLVQQYDQLVRRYYDLSRSRATRTMDRGTDPMELESEPSVEYFHPPVTTRSANWRGFSQARSSAGVPLHHTQRRSGRSRFIASRRITFSSRPFSRDSVGGQTPHRSSQSHSESSPRRFFHYNRRRQSAYNSSFNSSGTNTSGTLFIGRPSDGSGDLHNNNNTADQRVHVRTYEVGQSGPVLPSFSMSHYLQDWPTTAHRSGEERPPQQPHTDAPAPTRRDVSGSFFTYYRSAFEPRSPSGQQQPTARLFRANVGLGRQPQQESDNSADVGVRYGIQLLSRHIDNMQQLCRARLEILQLQQIRRMWEHLQRQIRSLHVAVRDGSMLPTNLDPPPQSVTDNASSHRAAPSESTSSTRSRGTSTTELNNLSMNSDSHISVATETTNVCTLERRPTGSPPTAQSTANVTNVESRSFQSLSLNSSTRNCVLVTSTGVISNCKTDDKVASSSTSSSSKEPTSGQGDNSAATTTRGTSSMPSTSGNCESEGQSPSLMSFLPFRRLSGLRRRRLLSAFLRIEREMGIGRSRCNSGVWNFKPPNLSRRQRSCGQEANSTQSTQTGSKGAGKRGYLNSCFRIRGTLLQAHDKASQSSKVAKDKCEVNTPSHTESQSMPSTSNGSSACSGSSISDCTANTPQASPAEFSGETSGTLGTKRAGSVFAESNEKTEELAGKRQKRACPSTHPISRRVEFEEQDTFPPLRHPTEILRTVATATSTPFFQAHPSSLRNASGSCPEPSTSRGAASQDTTTTESMALRPMIAHLEALVRQQRAYQRMNMMGARGSVPGSQTSDSTPGTRHSFFCRPSETNDGDSNSTAEQHRPSAEERLTSALENETEHINRLQQSPSGLQAGQNRSREGESTRLRARQVLSLMVESLTQFFEENGFSSNRPSPAVLDEQIYNLYVLLQLALELTDLLLAQLVSTRRELEHQWTHRLRSPVAVNASTASDQQRKASTASDQQRNTSTAPDQQQNASRAPDQQRNASTAPDQQRNASRTLDQQRNASTAPDQQRNTSSAPGLRGRQDVPNYRHFGPDNQVPDDLPPLMPISFTHQRDADIRNEYMMRVHRFRNSMPQTPPSVATPPENVNSNQQQRQQQQDIFTVPVVRVNDVLILDTASLNQQPRQRPQSPPLDFPGTVPHPQQLRYLHPRYYGYYNQAVDSSSAGRQDSAADYLRGLPGAPEHFIHDTPTMPTHRIQAWDFSNLIIPNISNGEKNIVASECKIHNDASVDISSDGHILVTLLPSGRLSMSTMLGVYSLQWRNLGQCLYTTSFEQNAVSVSLSPINRHLLVGLACRRIAPMSTDYLPMAQIFRLDGARIPGARGRLCLLRDIEQGREHGYMSINCIRWAPVPGQGLVYGTNTGQLKILR